jgi:zinc transport system substrate-binding protein
MKNLLLSGLLAGALLTAAPVLVQAAPSVVVSIKPIHSLVAAIMHGIGEPDVVIDGAASPHTYQMKPSDAARLQSADVIFWVGPEMEKFLEHPLETLGSKARIVELDNAEGLIKLPTRESGMFEPHADEDAHDHDGGEEIDMHLWLHTGNAKAMASLIAQTLEAADPANAMAYRGNLARLDTKLDALAADIAATVAPVKDKPFVVFHDAYQYFEKEFGVNGVGSITVTPENMPGAARIAEIHDKVKTLKSACVFAEPQFEPKLIKIVLEGTDARTGTLDPEAGTLAKGEDLYATMMLDLARSLKTCLSAGK